MFYIPVPSSYANAASNGVESNTLCIYEPDTNYTGLCPFSVNKPCPYGEDCEYVHGEICDQCGLAVLVPDDLVQQEQHKRVQTEYYLIIVI